jgi:hypothetical protein
MAIMKFGKLLLSSRLSLSASKGDSYRVWKLLHFFTMSKMLVTKVVIT